MANYKDLPPRSWSRLKDHWIEHIPLQFSVANGSIEPLIALSGRSLTDKGIIEKVPQLRETVLTLSLHLRAKGLYCIRAARDMNERGFPTWSSLLMYDACFFIAKSICYLLGISDVGRDSSYYLDIFYEEKRKKDLIDVGHQAFKLNERLSHKMLWTVFARMMNTFKVDDTEFSLRVKELRNNDYDKFSGERNRLFYTCLAWSREHDLENSDLSSPLVYEDNVNYFNAPHSVVSEYFHVYNHGGLALFSCLNYLLLDLGQEVPAVAELLDDHNIVPPINAYDFN